MSTQLSLSVICLSLILAACGSPAELREDAYGPAAFEPFEGGPVASVSRTPIFNVDVTEDVVYAQGQTHAAFGGPVSGTMDLLLDVYTPDRTTDAPLPAVVIIHGGGFTGGSKTADAFVNLSMDFASRGFVAFSIDYRVSGDMGTLPPDYPSPTEPVSEKEESQSNALYPACRDAKAAVRWVRANAEEYNINTEHLTAIGGAAGSYLALALGTIDEDDCKTEVSEEDGPTLASTHLEQRSDVATVIDHWGGTAIHQMLELMDGQSRFDATDAPLSIVHGTADATCPFEEAEAIQAAYIENDINHAWYPVVNGEHGMWEVVLDGRTLTGLAFDFIVAHQTLTVQ